MPFALILAACGITGDGAAILERIVEVESALVTYALNVNGGFELVRPPRDRDEAVAMARWLLGHGYNFDAGLGQVNSANFARLGLTVESAFEPCANLRAAGRILEECRVRAAARFGRGARTVRAALSCYNTGDFSRGMANGYVEAVLGAGESPRHRPSKGRERAEVPEGTLPSGPAVQVKDVFGEGAARVDLRRTKEE
jgi:type IV secretion system protein VirB1